MSIVALKNKARAMYTSHSQSPDGFSLNGKIRIAGITQNLGKSVTRTPMRGADPVGHGGGPRVIHNSGSCHTPQTEVKRSVMNTSGLLEKSFYAPTVRCTSAPPPQLDNTMRRHTLASIIAGCESPDVKGSSKWLQTCSPDMPFTKLAPSSVVKPRAYTQCKVPNGKPKKWHNC